MSANQGVGGFSPGVVGAARQLILAAETYLASDEPEDVRVEMAVDIEHSVPRLFDRGIDAGELVIALTEIAAGLLTRHKAVTGQSSIDLLKVGPDLQGGRG